MAKLQANLTETPTIDTSAPGESAGNAAKYVGAISVALFLFGIATMVAQRMQNRFSQLTGVDSDGSRMEVF